MTIEPKHWTLLAIAAAGGKPLSPVQLQKTLFVLGREMPDQVGDGYYDFRPYNYGPFAHAVYGDAEALAAQGLVNINRPNRWNEYAATPEGMSAAAEVRKQAPEKAVAYLKTVVNWARSLSFQDLVRAIYAKYPGTRSRSIFEDGEK